jgi:hypothetical protein
MAWWAWLLLGWVGAGLAVALVMGGAARVIKYHERAGRAGAIEPPRGGKAGIVPLPPDASLSEESPRAPRR